MNRKRVPFAAAVAALALLAGSGAAIAATRASPQHARSTVRHATNQPATTTTSTSTSSGSSPSGHPCPNMSSSGSSSSSSSSS
jgi:hypothetical protein